MPEIARPALADNAVHVWTVDLDSWPAADPSASLSEAERTRAAALIRQVDRHRYVRGRAALRTILSRYVDVAPHAIPIVAGEHGKPALAQDFAGPSISFNASGSEGLGLVGVAPAGRIGVDVERVRPMADLAGVARLVLGTAERRRFDALAPEDRLDHFHAIWVRKEAYVKALGEGLLRDLDRIECLTLGDGVGTLRDMGDPAASERWHLTAWRPTRESHAAVVTDFSCGALVHFNFSLEP